MVNCGGFRIDKAKLKVVNGILTKSDTAEVNDFFIANCGQLKLDKTIFKELKNKQGNYVITLVENESIKNYLFAPCGNVLVDGDVFEIKNNQLSLKQLEIMKTLTNNMPTIPVTKVTFESLDDFDIVLRDETQNIVIPIDKNIYELERTKLYFYEATNKDNVGISGEIKTSARQANLTKTLDF